MSHGRETYFIHRKLFVKNSGKYYFFFVNFVADKVLLMYIAATDSCEQLCNLTYTLHYT